MNAVMRKREIAEGAHMPANENDNLGIQVGELRADVRHVQSDATDIKADLRITNQRIEALGKETGKQFDKVDQKLETLRTETMARFDKVDQKFDKVDQKLEKVDQKIETVRKETAEVKDSLASAKLWALGLYVGLAGSLFYVLARGFRWL
jgi:chromosome segregation ATPase